MRSSILVKFGGVALVAILLALGTRTGVQAGPLAEVTSAPTVEASAVATTAAAATTVSAAATTVAAASTVVYPPCTETAATSAVATAAASENPVATVAVNDNPAYLGIRARNVDNCGAIIDTVVGTPAKLAKLQAGDVVVAVDGVALTGGLVQFRQIVEAHKPGDKVVLTIQRGGQQIDVPVTLGQRSQATPATQVATQAAAVASPAATQ